MFTVYEIKLTQKTAINPFPPRLATTVPFVILLCLMPDNFTCQGKFSGWEKVGIYAQTTTGMQVITKQEHFHSHNYRLPGTRDYYASMLWVFAIKHFTLFCVSVKSCQILPRPETGSMLETMLLKTIFKRCLGKPILMMSYYKWMPNYGEKNTIDIFHQKR